MIRNAAPEQGHSDPETILDYLNYLKRRVLGNFVVHHETIPARPEQLVHDLSYLPPAVDDLLKIAQIPALYTHQVEGIEKVLQGQHVAIATPTASGKTMVYNIPVLTTLLDDPTAHALYIFPLKALEVFQKQFVPRWTSTSNAQIIGIGEALRKIGPCILLCHSQGGFLGSRAAIENSDCIRAVICAEASGWPLLEDIKSETIKGKPWLLLLGDFIEQSERWCDAKKETQTVCEKINSVGGRAELVSLPEIGFSGATHMFMMDENSADISKWIGDWIKKAC